MLSDKDHATLIAKPNKLLADFYARVMIKDAPESLCVFYEQHSRDIDGKVVIVRSKADESYAAHARNTEDKVLFVFHDSYWLTSYFSGVCQNIPIPQALIKRSNA